MKEFTEMIHRVSTWLVLMFIFGVICGSSVMYYYNRVQLDKSARIGAFINAVDNQIYDVEPRL